MREEMKNECERDNEAKPRGKKIERGKRVWYLAETEVSLSSRSCIKP